MRTLLSILYYLLLHEGILFRAERQDNNLIVYGSAIFRDSKGIVYKNLDDKTFKEHGKDFLNNFGLSSLQFLFSSSYDEFSNN